MSSLWAVIMAGGGGTRFWPLSRVGRPKQFLAIAGERTMLQQAWERCVHVTGTAARVAVVTGERYAELTREQLPELAADNLLLEPEARNTAPCLAYAAAVLRARDPEAVMAVFPADHVIRDLDGLALSVRSAAAAAAVGYLVTFGVPPRYPETGYGYVEVGEPLSLAAAPAPVHEVRAFREKPDAATAKRYLEAGNFLWNSGMFVWRADALLAACERHLPAAGRAAAAMLAAGGDAEARRRAYADMPATSIDYGIMEVADNVACVRAQFDWSDVGSWEALHELLEGDDSGNAGAGEIVAVDARDNLVHAPGDVVALLGVERLAVVRAGRVLLVASLEQSQRVRQLRERVAARGLEDLL